MSKSIITRAIIRFGGYARTLNMYLHDALRWIRWWILGGRRHYLKNYDEISGSHKWIFIIGCNNSGTSIVQRIMRQTGSVSTMQLEGQRYTKIFPRAMRRGKERVWMEYEDDLSVKPMDMKKAAARLIFDWLHHIPEPVSECILEKTPANLLRMAWLDEALPNCYFIGLVRDGYAVAEGIRRKSHKSIERSAIQWSRANEALESNKRSVDNYMELRYEDLVGNPQEAFVRISEFLGIQALDIGDALNIDFGLKTVSKDKISGVKNLNQSSIDRLSDDDIATINRFAGDMLKRHGYYREPEAKIE